MFKIFNACYRRRGGWLLPYVPVPYSVLNRSLILRQIEKRLLGKLGCEISDAYEYVSDVGGEAAAPEPSETAELLNVMMCSRMMDPEMWKDARVTFSSSMFFSYLWQFINTATRIDDFQCFLYVRTFIVFDLPHACSQQRQAMDLATTSAGPRGNILIHT
jgi:hypothetical protein